MRSSALFLVRKVTRRCYRIRGVGLGRVCEGLRHFVARQDWARPLVIDDFQGSGKFICYLGEHMGSQIFFRGAYSCDALALLPNVLPRDGVFLDVGANQGEFTVAAALVAPQGRIVAVEPVVRNRERLQRNIQLNGFTNVEVVPCAVSDADGVSEIFDQVTDFSDGTHHEGLATLYAHKERSVPIERVAVARLDELWPTWGLERLDLVKLDIEGAEWPALRGAAGVLAKYRPALVVEIGRDTCRAAGYEPEALASWLVEHGYRLSRICTDGALVPLKADRLDDFQNVFGTCE